MSAYDPKRTFSNYTVTGSGIVGINVGIISTELAHSVA